MWIDYFRGAFTRQTELLDPLLDRAPLAVGDLILTEVLQGFVNERDFRQAAQLLTSLVAVDAEKKSHFKQRRIFARYATWE